MTQKAVFQLEALTCPTCVKKIETALSKTKGVDDVKVLFNASKVRTTFDTDVIEADALVDTLEKLGYPVKDKKVS